MFTYSRSRVGFWWIKPQANNPAQLERQTLDFHDEGPFKNAAGKARAVYEPLASKFNGEVDGDFTFGVDGSSGRAFIDETDGHGVKTRLFLYFVWQESWSSVMSSKKFMTGKLFYQKGAENKIFARQYTSADGHLYILEPSTEEEVSSLLPSDDFQSLFETRE